MKTQNKNGFTLIELLVVISIIAMLLSILMPALGAVKDQARRVVCMANLSQWGLILTLYTEDHDSHFFPGYYDFTDPNGVTITSDDSDLWPYALQSYYQVPELKFCPSAGFSRRGSSRSTWGSESDEIFSGSYGLNGWVGDTPKEVLQTEGHDTANSWRTMDHFGSSKIPLMADALWYTGRPESHDQPPEEEGQLDSDESQPDIDSDDWPNDSSNHMRRFSVNRHREKLNVLFMDGMVKSISPKELWRLKWHHNYDTTAPLPQWPQWMDSFKDPD
jgi:prepilin-type N-terminal cleavage/methylation domain-containing protein/prepilin-type processing-associated H-X9-DG protein